MNEFLASANEMGLPAPIWFLKFFKILGFILHMCMMNIWYVGMPLAALLSVFGKGDSKRIGERLVLYMPIIIALGINFGIVPLLFIQTLYYSVYYPAGILIAWSWLSVIVFLIFAYYGVYIYTNQVKRNLITSFGKFSGWVSAICFVVIGFLFTNNFTLLVNKKEWMRIYFETNVGGAVHGFALNLNDPTLFPRWLFVIGLSLMTTAVYLIIDSVFFAKRESESYKTNAVKFAFNLFSIGIIWSGITGAWYIFSTMNHEVLEAIKSDSLVTLLFIVTSVSVFFPWLIILIRKRSFSNRTAILLAILQFLVLTLNALSRQWVQDFEVAKIVDIHRETIAIQWSSMIPFLVIFILGAGVLFWMIKKIISLKSI